MKIVFLDAGSLGTPLDLSCFEALGDFTAYPSTQPDQVADRIAGADIVLTNKVILDKAVLDKARIKLVAITATGLNVVDLEDCKEKGIAVTNVAGYSTESVAQHTLALVLGLLENLAYYDHYTKSKAYTENAWGTHQVRPFYQLDGKNWGIVGLGNIGQATAKLAQAFGAQVRYYSTTGRNKDPRYERLSLADLLKTSDIISLHAPLSEDTHHLMDADSLSLVKKNALVCNVARGALVDEAAMAQALKADKLRGYATDVYETEPPAKDNPLFSVPDHKILMTPHMAFCSNEARATLLKELEETIQSFMAGGRRNRVV